MRLLAAVTSSEAPPGLREMEQVEILRQIWVHHFHLVEGEFRRRDPKGRPPGATRLVTPYAPQARGSVKRDTVWDGYKVHLTETCGTDGPNLITNMATTVATVPDSVMSETIHADLAEHGCLPGEHWVDTGYPTAAQIVTARREHGIELHGPLQSVTVAQAKNGGGYGQDAFTIDWDQQHVTCPNGATSTLWSLRSSAAASRDPDHVRTGRLPPLPRLARLRQLARGQTQTTHPAAARRAPGPPADPRPSTD